MEDFELFLLNQKYTHPKILIKTGVDVYDHILTNCLLYYQYIIQRKLSKINHAEFIAKSILALNNVLFCGMLEYTIVDNKESTRFPKFPRKEHQFLLTEIIKNIKSNNAILPPKDIGLEIKAVNGCQIAENMFYMFFSDDMTKSEKNDILQLIEQTN